MRRLISFSVVILLTAASAAYAQDRGKSKEQIEFGIKVAQLNLWNEALYRWTKATELDPTYAAAWNNLAIALEHEGKFDDAKKGLALLLRPWLPRQRHVPEAGDPTLGQLGELPSLLGVNGGEVEARFPLHALLERR